MTSGQKDKIDNSIRNNDNYVTFGCDDFLTLIKI